MLNRNRVNAFESGEVSKDNSHIKVFYTKLDTFKMNMLNFTNINHKEGILANSNKTILSRAYFDN